MSAGGEFMIRYDLYFYYFAPNVDWDIGKFKDFRFGGSAQHPVGDVDGIGAYQWFWLYQKIVGSICVGA